MAVQANKKTLFFFSILEKKSRIRTSGIATLRKHSLPTQPRRREEERAWFIK
jgi:hypothetical protein